MSKLLVLTEGVLLPTAEAGRHCALNVLGAWRRSSRPRPAVQHDDRRPGGIRYSISKTSTFI
jgi:hypothetical protein